MFSYYELIKLLNIFKWDNHVLNQQKWTKEKQDNYNEKTILKKQQ